MDKKDRLNQVFQYLKEQGLVHKQKDLADAMHTTAPNVSSALKGVETVLTDSFLKRLNAAFDWRFNDSWLLTGEGNMLRADDAQPPQQPKGVPFYDHDFACGFLEMTDVADHPSAYVNLPGTERATCWCRATGISMQPLIDNGDYVCLQRIDDPVFLVYGETYAFDCVNGMRTIKKLGRGSDDDSFRLIPVNKEVDEQDIPKSIIRNIFRVVAVAKYL